MALLDRLGSAMRALFGTVEKTGVPIDEWFRDYGWTGTESAAGIAVNQWRAMQAAAVMACVSIRSRDVAKLPPRLVQIGKDGGRVLQRGHAVDKLLLRPNPWQSRFEFIELMQAHYLLRGNAYAAIVRDGRGDPVMLVPLNPDWVSLYQGAEGQLFYRVARNGPHVAWALASLPMMVPAEDMLHHRWLSMDGGLTGISRIAYAREVIGLALAQQEQAGRWIRNGTQSSGILSPKQPLTPDKVDELRKNWKEQQAGLVNTGGTLLVPFDHSYSKLGMTSVDAEFIAARNLQVEEIARIFEVPSHKVGVAERAANATAQADQEYHNHVVVADCDRWDGTFNRTFDLGELQIWFDLSQALKADILTRFNAYRSAITGGWMKPNEARRGEGLPADDVNGDRLYMPANILPLGQGGAANAGAGSDLTGAAAPGGSGDPTAPEAPAG